MLAQIPVKKARESIANRRKIWKRTHTQTVFPSTCFMAFSICTFKNLSGNAENKRKAKCNKIQWKQTLQINHDLHEACDVCFHCVLQYFPCIEI